MTLNPGGGVLPLPKVFICTSYYKEEKKHLTPTGNLQEFSSKFCLPPLVNAFCSKAHLRCHSWSPCCCTERCKFKSIYGSL